MFFKKQNIVQEWQEKGTPNPKKIFTIFLSAIVLFLLVNNTAIAQVVNITNETPSYLLSKGMEEFVDIKGETPVEEVLRDNRFIKTNGNIPIFSNKVKSVWFRFSVQNSSSSPVLYLNITYTNLSKLSLYKITHHQATLIGEQGNSIANTTEHYRSPNIVFNLNTSDNQVQEYVLHVYSEHPIIIPAEISTADALNQSSNLQSVVTAVYMGVLMVMFLYNLFLFFATKDNNYFYYIVYIFFLCIAQTTLAGYEYKYLWPGFPGLNRYSVVFTSSFSAISGLVFSMHFLRTSLYAQKIHLWLRCLVGIYIIGLVCSLFFDISICYQILNYNGLLGVFSVLFASFYIAKKNFKPAYFYLTAWLFFLVSFIILILRNLAILPYNNFTTYTIYVGSSLEVALLSIALADKINALRKEKDESQAESLKASLLNEKLVRDQNLMLEKKVTERTEELLFSNKNLSVALQNLKDAQTQLVEAEKMASLGQLTAGIAHEINNPINFVKSNIGPLQLDINDLISIIDEYDSLHTAHQTEIPGKLAVIEKNIKNLDLDYVKTEIENLVKGIREGAERTAEIVTGLRTFSRLDEGEIKIVNLYDGLDSTLVLLRNMLPANIKVEKDCKADGNIECYPGKLNQVFMNILSNAIQAIKQKEQKSENEFIRISTQDLGNQIVIRIQDSGPGMNEEVKRKIFDPFFTTKGVGEGTGLGLSIVYKIIQMHYGKIEVFSTVGKGAEFVITLNHTLPKPIALT